jgi:hypothetical protein
MTRPPRRRRFRPPASRSTAASALRALHRPFSWVISAHHDPPSSTHRGSTSSRTAHGQTVSISTPVSFIAECPTPAPAKLCGTRGATPRTPSGTHSDRPENHAEPGSHTPRPALSRARITPRGLIRFSSDIGPPASLEPVTQNHQIGNGDQAVRHSRSASVRTGIPVGSTRHGVRDLLRTQQQGPVEQFGVLATLSRWRPRVQIPSGPLRLHVSRETSWLGSSVGTSDRLKSDRSPVRPRPQPHRTKTPSGCPEGVFVAHRGPLRSRGPPRTMGGS